MSKVLKTKTVKVPYAVAAYLIKQDLKHRDYPLTKKEITQYITKIRKEGKHYELINGSHVYYESGWKLRIQNDTDKERKVKC